MPVNSGGIYDINPSLELICEYLEVERRPWPDEVDKLIFAAFDEEAITVDAYTKLALKLQANGTMQWLRGPHGATLFKALLIKKGLKL
jgi:hypothetical protein